MNELLDKVIIRLFFAFFICAIIFFYKHLHRILYPSSRDQIFKRFYPSKNSPDTLHLFARILGIGIIFSEFYFHMSSGILISMLDFFMLAMTSSILYLASIYIAESIVLYNFEYADEILKRKNLAYSIVSFAMALGLAFIIKSIIFVIRDYNSVVYLLFIWIFTVVLFGFATKTFPFYSALPFNRLLIQKNIAVAFTYSGFIWGWSVLISSAISHEMNDIKWYTIQAFLKLLLSIIILPLFRRGLVMIFEIKQLPIVKKSSSEPKKEIDSPEVGEGIFEGIIFFTSCFLTTVITGNINFGTFYPIF